MIEWNISPRTRAQQGCTNMTPSAVCQATASLARARARREKLHRKGKNVAGLRSGGQDGALNRRDRQGRHRIPNDLLQELDRWSFSS